MNIYRCTKIRTMAFFDRATSGTIINVLNTSTTKAKIHYHTTTISSFVLDVSNFVLAF